MLGGGPAFWKVRTRHLPEPGQPESRPLISLFYRSPRPLVIYLLIAINALVFLYQLSLSDLQEYRFIYQFGLVPWELTTGEEVVQRPVHDGVRVWVLDVASPIPTWGTIFSSMFVHSGWMHFGLNMLFLWIAGEGVEARVGHIKLILLYAAAGAGGVGAHVLVNTDSLVPLVGASGAISGILGVYLVVYPLSRSTLFIGFWFVSQLLNIVSSHGADASEVGIAYMAHIGGFLAGVLLMGVFRLLGGGKPGMRQRQEYFDR